MRMHLVYTVEESKNIFFPTSTLFLAKETKDGDIAIITRMCE